MDFKYISTMGVNSSRCKTCKHDHSYHIGNKCEYKKLKKKCCRNLSLTCSKCNHHVGKSKRCKHIVGKEIVRYSPYSDYLGFGVFGTPTDIDVEEERDKYCDCNHKEFLYDVIKTCKINCNKCTCDSCEELSRRFNMR